MFVDLTRFELEFVLGKKERSGTFYYALVTRFLVVSRTSILL